jgi:hypothetical protein
LYGTGQAYGCSADIPNTLNLKAAPRVAASFFAIRCATRIDEKISRVLPFEKAPAFASRKPASALERTKRLVRA